MNRRPAEKSGATAGPGSRSYLASAIARSGLDATGIGGEPATSVEYRFDAEGTVRLLGAVLAKLHAVELTDAELDLALDPAQLVESARALSSRPSDQRPARASNYAHIDDGRLVEILAAGAARVSERTRPDVLTHGSPTLANLICLKGSVLGLIGWSAAAVADPHRDLAVAATSVAADLSPLLVPALIEAYGPSSPDVIAMDWYALAAELTRE